jgi:DNA repair exonuclease SbcCD ATPase subunit
VELDGRVAELAALQQRHDTLVQEQAQYQAANESRLEDDRLRFQTLQQQINDLERSRRDGEGALTVAQGERDTALGEVREARQSHSAALETIRNLQNEIQTKGEVYASLLHRYNYVDQEYRQLMAEMAGNEA